MKKILKILSLITLLFVAVNCNDENDFGFVEPEDTFTIVSPSSGASLILDSENEQNIALTMVWEDNVTNSSSYTVDMSTTEEFTESITIGSSSTNTFSLSVESLNTLLLDYNIPAFEESTLYFRVGSDNQYTDVISLVISSYPQSNPVITSPDSTFDVVLSDITEDETALTVTWDDPDFSDNTPVIINYNLEVAVAGTDFAVVENIGTSSERMDDTTHGELNDAALNLGLAVDAAGSLDVRVRSVIETASGDLERISDFITITVTPYETALLPVIYGVGAGLPDAGWGWDSPVELLLQGSVYSGNVNLQNNGGADNNFRFFAQMDWGPTSFNYPWYESRGFAIDENLVNANDGDSNFAFVGTTGQYFLEIDMENKTITLGPPIVGPNCEYDQLWLVGAGIPDAGWGWDTPVQLPCTGNGVYSGNVNLQNNGGADNNFRFFAQQDWGPTSFNYPFYADNGYTIDANFTNAMDGDSNFAFIGTTGEYFLTVDTINLTITLGPPQTACEYDQLWLVGAGITDAGWSWDSPVELPCTGAGIYTTQVNLSNGAFRFFAQQDWGPTSFNYPYYESEGYTIDSNLINANDGDSNFEFTGTPGTYTLTLDTVSKTISIQ
ncbi:SusE domain-containing protein [Hanstruepera marina]|uniref:SusE domain-containing protein n=1 Tax=Hanstruepera marina TaxID=2873265 RepID=UPI001CA7B661|nr:SusE domain-containing protein [Hanstruepera marina]